MNFTLVFSSPYLSDSKDALMETKQIRTFDKDTNTKFELTPVHITPLF